MFYDNKFKSENDGESKEKFDYLWNTLGTGKKDYDCTFSSDPNDNINCKNNFGASNRCITNLFDCIIDMNDGKNNNIILKQFSNYLNKISSNNGRNSNKNEFSIELKLDSPGIENWHIGFIKLSKVYLEIDLNEFYIIFKDILKRCNINGVLNRIINVDGKVSCTAEELVQLIIDLNEHFMNKIRKLS